MIIRLEGPNAISINLYFFLKLIFSFQVVF